MVLVDLGDLLLVDLFRWQADDRFHGYDRRMRMARRVPFGIYMGLLLDLRALLKDAYYKPMGWLLMLQLGQQRFRDLFDE